MPTINPYHRLGGYTISLEAAAEWAYHVEGLKLHPIMESPTTYMILRPILRHLRIDFKKVGERENSKFMFVTQSGQFYGYDGIPPSEMRQFKKCGQDEMVRQFLDSQGMLWPLIIWWIYSLSFIGVRNYKFETVFIWFTCQQSLKAHVYKFLYTFHWTRKFTNTYQSTIRCLYFTKLFTRSNWLPS